MHDTRTLSEGIVPKMNYIWKKRNFWWFIWLLIILVGCNADHQEVRKLYQVIDAQPERIAIAFSPDNLTFAFTTVDHQIQVRNLSNNRILQSLPYTDENPPLSLTFSPDSKQLAVSTITEIQIWEVENNQLLKSLLVDDLYPYSGKTMAFSHEGLLLALNTGDTLRIWDILTGEIVTDTDLEHYRFYSGYISFSPDDNLIALFNGYLHIWDLENQALVTSIPDGADTFSFTTDSMELVSTKRNEVFRWSMPDGDLIDNFTIEDNLPLLAVLPSDAKEVVEFSAELAPSNEGNSPNQRFDFYISLWRVEDGEMLWRIPTDDLKTDKLGYIVTSPTGDYIALIGIGNGIDIWQIR